MGLEVYHALHCVNAIRMYIFPDNYEFREKKSETELHKRKSYPPPDRFLMLIHRFRPLH